MSHKVFKDAAAALEGLTFDGMTVMSGGFGLCGIPENLIRALREIKNSQGQSMFMPQTGPVRAATSTAVEDVG